MRFQHPALLFLAVLACFILISCKQDDGDEQASNTYWSVNDWESPLKPNRARISGDTLSIPAAPGSANYVTRPGKLTTASTMKLSFTLDAPVTAKENPSAPATATLYFQRKGDNWSAQGPYETYRWYASFATVKLVGPGEYHLEAPLSERWIAVQGSNSFDSPEAFLAAIENVEKVGFVLGGGGGLGHGVTGPAKLTINSFSIE